MAVVRTLKAMAEIPVRKRNTQVQSRIKSAAEYLLEHRIYKRSHDVTVVAKEEWLKFGFPLLWNTDALDMLGLLVKLGYRDQRMQDAVDLVVSKQDGNGRWNLETTFNGRFHVNIERKGKPSKWVTLRALTSLRGYMG
jgi:hypothetical protein